MKLSTLWLREWVNFSITEKELANQLTMAGLEVDSISPVAGEFTNVIVAEVLSTKPHPDADKLTLCEVNANTDKPLNIVCGATNVRAGLKVALAMIGAQLPGGFKIKESKLRGQLSQGMLCSLSELGLADSSEGIMELQEDAPVGMNLRDYLSLNDYVLDIDLTPNRADCFSVLGIAREVAVLNHLSLTKPALESVTPSIDDVLGVKLSNPDACPRYCGRVIRGIRTDAKTPLWMTERLRRSGLRTVHPVVDIMNYVMLELGQPMHAFDLACIKGDINVRFSNESEQLELLDGQEVTLNKHVLVIADQEKPLAMAGIMGGAESAVQADTKDVFLESAFFNPVMIAGVARKYGLFSDSSQRYERGVDPQLQVIALERATALLMEITGGSPGPVIESTHLASMPAQVSFTFDTTKVKRLTGIDIPVEQMKRFLEGLGLTISKENNLLLTVNVPSHRFDIQQDVDLVEEIIRLYGYDNLIAQPMHGINQSGSSCANETIALKSSHFFRTRGYNETISYSFVDPALQEALYPEKDVMQLLNPISSELSQMRAGMWPGLIASMIHNIHRQQTAVKFFEIGVVFDVQHQELTERPCIAGLLMGEKDGLNWSELTRQYDFFDLKGDVQALCSLFHTHDISFKAAEHHALHPGKSAEIVIQGQSQGWIGVLHPRLADELDIQHEVVLFELNLQALVNATAPKYKPVSKYPQIRRDLSFLVDAEVNVSDIESAIRTTITEDWLRDFAVFDVYMGKGVPEGKKSLAVAMILQDENRTLVDAEINSLISAILKTLEDKFAINLRE